MADRAFITTKVFKWARESARMPEEIAASKASVSVDKLKAWENGESYPTIRQAKILAKSYKRPFALFFLPDIPSDFQPLQDFRKKGSKALSTSSVFIIREIQQKQAWTHELKEENNESPLPFIGRFSIQDNPEAVAKDILKGGPNYYLLQLNRNSRLFTQTVLDEYRGGNIEPTDASNLLNIKVNKFPKLEAQMYR